RAMILAAGFGTRLGTLSDERPKPMLPVCDIPLIRYAVALLRGHGIDEIAVNLHHRGDLIRAELGADFYYSDEPTILGTGRGLTTGGQGAPAAHACMFTGVHVLSPSLVARLPATGESDSIRQAYIPALLDGERIEGVRYDGYWHEHSTPERYLQGNWNLLSGAVTLAHPPGPLRAIAPDATVEPGASLTSQVVVGARTRIRAGACLDRVVVWPDCTVDGALSDAIVTPKGIVTAAPAAPARR